jgi:hypothetical protein
MRLDEVHLVTKQLLRSTNAEVSKIEALLETRFPPGFRKWMTTLGAGVLCDWVRVYRLPDLLLLIVEARARWREYDFWPQGHDVLAREAVWGSIVVADTLDGDEAVFHPSNPAGLYLLPRHEARIHRIGARFEDGLEWLCTSGVVSEPVSRLYFEPFPPRPDARETTQLVET